MSVKIIVYLVAVNLFFAGAACAQEILVRKESFSTEVFLRVSPQSVADVERDGSMVQVTFTMPLRQPFSQTLDDQLISSVQASGTIMTVTFNPQADFAVFNDADGLRFIATRPRELDNVLLSYDVGAPHLRADNSYVDDPVMEAQFRRAETYAANRQFNSAAEIYNVVISTTRSDFYRHEAMFRLANLYLEMGAYDPLYYYDASNAFDNFITEYPDSNRFMPAMIGSADAKMLGGQLTDSVNAHRQVYDLTQDASIKRNMLIDIADIYTTIGQYDDAIATYEEYLDNFQTDAENVRSTLGKLYLDQRHRGQEYQDKAYRMFSIMPVNTLTSELSPEEILALAEIFDKQNDPEKALALYEFLADGMSAVSTEAMSGMADVYRRQGEDEAYSETLSGIVVKDPQSQFAFLAMVEYGEKHFPEMTGDEWIEYYIPLSNSENAYIYSPRADMVITKAYYDDRDTFNVEKQVDQYLIYYPETEDRDLLLNMKEELLYDKAVEYQNDKQYYPALGLYNQLLEQFPESSRVPVIRQSIDDIYYDMASASFTGDQYSDTVQAVEDRMYQQSGLSTRWETLWDDAAYGYIANNLDSLDYRTLRYKSREYLTFMPRGRHVNEVRAVLEAVFSEPYYEAATQGNNAEVINLYEENRQWLDSWPNQVYSNRAKIAVTRSLMDIGTRDRAAEMFKTISPMIIKEYAELGYGLCQPNVIFDINRLTVPEFEKVVDEAELCQNPDYTFDLIRKYTIDKKTSLKAEYALSKNITDDRRRETLLNGIHAQIMDNPANQFEGSEEVSLDVGLIAYRKNDFSGAIVPLQQYADVAPADSEKRAEALYYIGKSLMAINERDRAFEYFTQVAALPQSIYKTLAQSELEDSTWRSNLNRN